MNQDNQPNSHITEYLDYYCGLTQAPEFAILLKGQWGSGKTWFIDKYREKFNENKQKCLYVSLYGATTFAEIEDQFFQQLHPVLSSKGMAITGKIFKGLLKGALKIDLNNDGKEDIDWNIQTPEIDLTKYFKDADRSILIFDDLERCKIDLGNILGYINSFVEHQGLKVIIIANEDELFKRDNGNLPSGYKAIKEKLIGKTFGISPDLHGALEDFIGKVEVEKAELKRFLTINTKVIEDVYKKAEHENLRNLKQIILDFERIFKMLPKKAKDKPEFLQDLLKSLMAFSIEIKRGMMLPEDINNFKESYFPSFEERIASSKLKSEEQFMLAGKSISSEDQDKFYEKVISYTKLYESALLFPSKVWWQTFFDKGIIDIQELEQSLPNSRHFQDEHTPNWLKLWYFGRLNDNEFEVLLKQLESEYDDRNFLAIGEIMHVVGIFLKFSDIGLYNKNKKDILNDGKLYLDALKDSNQLDLRNISQSNILSLTYQSHAGHRFQGKELKEFTEFCHYIDGILKPARVESMRSAGRDLMDIMQSDPGRFYRMICSTNSQRSDKKDLRYHEIPIFTYIETCKFIEKFLSMKLDDQYKILQALSERYRVANYYKGLIEELEWLKSVQKLLLEEVNNRKGKLSGYNLEQLNKEYLNGTIKDLEAIKAQPN
jgi:KAP family P-loop domain